MADVKITALTAISSNPVNPATFPIPMVDLLDNAITASGPTKKVTVNQILGAGGVATLASATITGALTVDTTTLVVDATNDRVGVNTATFDTNWGPKLQTSSASTDGSGGIVIESYKPNLILKDSSVGAQRRHIYADGGVQYFGYGDASIAEHLSIGTTGNVSVALGNVVMGTSGKGIDFSAVTGGTGTATANVLSDYEEGTFTPTLTFGGASVGMIGTFSGRYTKVGRAVTVSGLITITTRGTSTGNATIGGLPFTSAAGDYVAASLRLASISFTDAFQGYVSQSSTAIVLEQITNAGTESALTHSNFSVGSSFLIWNCTYTV